MGLVFSTFWSIAFVVYYISKIELKPSHPAEVSGPSPNSDLTFIGIPAELRLHIYRQLLLKNRYVLIEMRPAYWGWYIEKPKTAIGPKNITSILRVSQQVHAEAVEILYGENVFRTYNHIRAFDKMFVNGAVTGESELGIGRLNASRIKSVIFEMRPWFVHSRYYRKPTQFHHFLCHDLSGLHSLSLSNTVMAWDSDHDQARRLKRARRTLLRVAAEIAKRHPILKQAVWRHWNEAVVDEQKFPLIRDGTTSTLIWVELQPLTHRPKNSGGSIVAGDFPRKDNLTTDIVLDCKKIREMPPDKLFRAKIEWLALPEDSKIAKPGSIEYEDDVNPITAASQERDSETEAVYWTDDKEDKD